MVSVLRPGKPCGSSSPCWRVWEVLWPLPSPPSSTLDSQFPSFFQILLLIDIEQSYINTNHEDFIGFAKYVLSGTAAGGGHQGLLSGVGPEGGG